MKHQFFAFTPDFIGFSASLLCAIHCAALPFLLTLVPLTGLQVLSSPWVEYSMIIFSFVIAFFSLIHGYRRHHHLKMPLVLVFIGFAMIGTGHCLEGEWQETVLTPFGATLIAIAHMINWKFVHHT